MGCSQARGLSSLLQEPEFTGNLRATMLAYCILILVDIISFLLKSTKKLNNSCLLDLEIMLQILIYIDMNEVA